MDTLKKKLLAAENAAKASPPAATESPTKQIPASRVTATVSTSKVTQEEVTVPATKVSTEKVTPIPTISKVVTTKKSFEGSPTQPEAKV